MVLSAGQGKRVAKVELVEAKGENHIFHIRYPNSTATTKLIEDVAKFLNA